MNVIITDCEYDSVAIEQSIIEGAGLTFQRKQAREEDEIIRECKNAEIFLVQYGTISRKVMEALPELKCIIRYGVGVDSIDLDAAAEFGIQVGNVPDYGVNEVADHALSLLLGMARKTFWMSDYTKTKAWDYRHSVPIRRFSEQTVGVIGLGRIGLNFAKKAQALGFQVIGFDSYTQLPEDTGIRQVSFAKLLSESDYISIHCPLSEETRNLFRKDTFEKMKNTSYLINVSRGGIIQEEDLEAALANGQIKGAAVDCMAKEPADPDSKLFQHPSFIVTPHMAWYSEEASQELKQKAAQEAVRFAKGEQLHYRVR